MPRFILAYAELQTFCCGRVPGTPPPWVWKLTTAIAPTALLSSPLLCNMTLLISAHFWNIDEICDQTSDLPHMMPSPAQVEENLIRFGIRDSQQHILVYDNAGLLRYCVASLMRTLASYDRFCGLCDTANYIPIWFLHSSSIVWYTLKSHGMQNVSILVRMNSYEGHSCARFSFYSKRRSPPLGWRSCCLARCRKAHWIRRGELCGIRRHSLRDESWLEIECLINPIMSRSSREPRESRSTGAGCAFIRTILWSSWRTKIWTEERSVRLLQGFTIDYIIFVVVLPLSSFWSV